MTLEQLLAMSIRNAANSELTLTAATIHGVSWCCEKAKYILNRKHLLDNPDNINPDSTIREIYMQIKNKEKNNEVDVWNG